MAPRRTKAQRAKRAFCTRRQGLMRKLHEMNTLTEASVALIGVYKGKTFCYAEDGHGVLERFGIPDQFSDRFGPDDVELVRQRNHRSFPYQDTTSSSSGSTPASTSPTADFTAPLADSTSPALPIMSSNQDPLTSLFPVGDTTDSPSNTNSNTPPTNCRPPGLFARPQQGNLDFLDIDFFGRD